MPRLAEALVGVRVDARNRAGGRHGGRGCGSHELEVEQRGVALRGLAGGAAGCRRALVVLVVLLLDPRAVVSVDARRRMGRTRRRRR